MLELAHAREWLLTLPPEQRESARLALKVTWGDGFGCGAARLPALNPFATVPPPEKKA